MRFAIADPPYPGQSKKHYGGHKDYAGEVDHEELISRLASYDAWLLCTSSAALQYVLSCCPSGVRVGSWVKPFCAWKKNVSPAYSWEPVIWHGGRKRGYPDTVRDFISEPITMKRGLVGAKPEKVCFWYFDLLGAEPGDEMEDLFPGTRAVSKAWEKYCAIREGKPLQDALL